MRFLQQSAKGFFGNILGDDAVTHLVRDGGVALSVRIAGLLTLFGTHIALARILGTEVYGRYALVIAYVNLGMLVGKLGLDNAALKFIPTYLGTGRAGAAYEFHRHSTRVLLCGASLAAIVLAVLTLRFAPNGAWLGALIVPASAILQLRSAELRACGRHFAALASPEILRPAGTVLALLILGGLSRRTGLREALLANLAATVLIAVGTSWLISKILTTQERDTEAQRDGWLGTAIPLMLVAGFHMVMSRTDLLMVGALLDDRSAGIYAAVSRIGMLVSFGTLALHMVVTPMISRLHAAGERASLLRILTFATWAAVISGIVVATVIVFFGDELLGAFGTDFVQGTRALRVYALGQAALLPLSMVGPLMTMTGHQTRAAWSLSLMVILNIVLNFVLIERWGLVGAALSTVSVKLIWHLYLAGVSRRSLTIDWNGLLMGRYL